MAVLSANPGFDEQPRAGGMVHTIEDAIEQIGVGRFQWRLLLVNGLVWASDAMEVLIIGFVLPAISRLWGLTPAQSGLVAAATFAGMMLGAWFWGSLADRIGRRRVFLVTVLMDAVFGLLSALSPNLAILLLLRFLTGTAIGGTLPVDYAVMSEFLPRKQRGPFLVYLESFWSIGTIILALLAWWLIPSLPENGWRWLLVASALPGLLGFWVRISVPESPRYLLVNGQEAEARRVLQQVASENGRAVQIGKLQVPQRHGGLGLLTIWSSSLVQRTILLSVVWFGLSLGYYGIFTWLPSIFVSQGFSFVRSYSYIVLLALAQVPGYILAALLVNRIGRKATLGLFLTGSAIASFPAASESYTGTVVGSAALLSFALLGAWGAVYTFTPELYPTEVRATGMGWASAMARVAGVLAPNLGAALLSVSLPLALGVYAGFLLLAALAGVLIPVETRDAALTDTV